MTRPTSRTVLVAVSLIWLLTITWVVARNAQGRPSENQQIHEVIGNATAKVTRGREAFRFDTFGDQRFWGDTLRLHQAIEGVRFGGVGPGVSPKTALSVGLKVDIDALPPDLVDQVLQGRVNLDDPAVTLALLKLNAVVGVTGSFNDNGSLRSVGIQCSLCHSSVDRSVPALCAGAITPNPGTGCIGHRLDGWANRDLNVGAIIALSPNLDPFTGALGASDAVVRSVLNSWGPGKFDAELLLDGKAFNPQQMTDHIVTGTNVPGATLIPPAFGLGGVNLHTWTGWGSVPYWNAIVANLEMRGVGRFYDARLSDPVQFPVAARTGVGDLPHVSPSDDRITSKLSDLQFYQLAIPSPQPPADSFDRAAADRGEQLFDGKAACNSCHVRPSWTDAGWNMHTASEICIDDFQASRSPDRRYRTAPLGALFTHLKGGFYHDGRFPTLDAVIDHYNTCMTLGLSSAEKSDLRNYLSTLTFDESK
jgi:hypothetical protein